MIHPFPSNRRSLHAYRQQPVTSGHEQRYRLFRNTFFLVYILAFFLSPPLLERWGIPYISRGGSYLYKIHIYSLVLLLLTSIIVFRRGIVFLLIKPLPITGYAPNLFVVGTVWVALYGVLKGGMGGMAYIVDTLLTPGLAVLILPLLRAEDRRRLFKLITGLLLLNCLVAIMESIGKFYLINSLYSWNARASAFMGHPLNNALILLICFPLLIQQFTNRHRLFVTVLVLLALFGFGARAATALLMIPIMVMWSVAALLFFTDRMKARTDTVLLVYFGFLFSIPIIIFLIDSTGIGSRIFENIDMGDASAKTRFDVYKILYHLSFDEWLNGASSRLMILLPDIINNGVVENFWIGWLLQFGLIGMLPMGFALICFNGRLVILGSTALKLAALVFLAGSYTNNSLSAKTPALLFYFTMVGIFIMNIKNLPVVAKRPDI